MILSYKHFSNHECEYYPCHKLENQNCLFCYCPLYFFKDCGGNPRFNGAVKDCTLCTMNHDENSFEFVMSQLKPVFKRLGKDLQMLTLTADNSTEKE